MYTGLGLMHEVNFMSSLIYCQLQRSDVTCVVFDLKDLYYAERDLLAIAKFLTCIVL